MAQKSSENNYQFTPRSRFQFDAYGNRYKSSQYTTWSIISSKNLDGYLSASFFGKDSILYLVTGSWGNQDNRIRLKWPDPMGQVTTWAQRTTEILSSSYANSALWWPKDGATYICSRGTVYRCPTDPRTGEFTGYPVGYSPNEYFESILADGNVLYVLGTWGDLYHSTDGKIWTLLESDFPLWYSGSNMLMQKYSGGLVIAHGTYGIWFYKNGVKKFFPTPYTIGALATVDDSVYCIGGDFIHGIGVFMKFDGNQVVTLATTPVYLNCAYNLNGRVYSGWDEEIYSEGTTFLYSMIGDELFNEAKGSMFPGWNLHARVRNIFSYPELNMIIATSGGGLGNQGVIYTKQVSPQEFVIPKETSLELFK